MSNINQWFNTGAISLAVGFLGYRSTRAGQKTQAKANEAATKVQEATEHRLEIQQALDAQKSISDQWRQAAIDRQADNANLKAELRTVQDEKKALLELVMRQVNASAEVTEQAISSDSPGVSSATTQGTS